MVRTKADCAASRKVVAARAPRKSLGASPGSSGAGSSSSSKSRTAKNAGMNPVCPRPTPTWQKSISNFLMKGDGYKGGEDDDEEAGPSSRLIEDDGAGPSSSSSPPTSEQDQPCSSGSSSDFAKNNLIDSESDED